MSNDRRLKRVDHADIQIDTQTTARVVESLVLRGDISALNPEERSRFYLQICDSLGLAPATLPFAILRLNGKEVLYPTRAATDQLAAFHRLTREIVDGPRLIDIGGAKIVLAVCRATHPNGRIETATGMVPLKSGAEDVCNSFLKAETKAKRRATLSLLGLGMMDESELDTVPAHLKSAAPPIVLQQQPEATPAEPPAETPPAPTLANFYARLEQIELPGECVAAWIRYRDDLAKLPKADGEAAWTALCKRCEDVGKMKNAKAWLKRAIAEEDARVSSHEPDDVFSHATTTPAQSSVANDDVAPEIADSPALDALRADLEPLKLIDAKLLQAARVWREHSQAIYDEAGGDAKYLYDAQKLVLDATRVTCTRNQLNEHTDALILRDKASSDGTYADVMDLLGLADTADEVVEVWKTQKNAIAMRSEEMQLALRRIATRRVQELLPDMANAKAAAQWLKNALAPKDPPKPPSGGTPKPDAPAANDSDPERDAAVDADHARENNQFAQADSMPPAQALRTRLAECKVTKHLYNTLFKYGPDLVTKEQGAQICAERMVETGAHLVSALKAVREEIDRRGWKRSRRAA